MTLDQLETFVQVARARSFSRAAVMLGLAQPTLSGRVATLEAELGSQLFRRRGHTLELTEAGRVLLPYAERMLALRTEGKNAVRRVAEGSMGRLTLGANPTCSQYLVPRLIEDFWSVHPALPTWVRTALSPLLMEALLDGTIQLALCSRAQLDPRAEVLWRYEEPLVVVVARDHPLARKGVCQRSDLAAHTVLSTQAGPTRLGLRHLLPPGAESHILLEATAGEVMKRLLLRGAGLTVLPTIAVWEELERGELVSITVSDGDLPSYEVALVKWPGRELSPGAAAFVERIRATNISALLSPKGRLAPGI